MEQKKVSENISELTGQVKDYVRLRIDLFKLTLTEKLSVLATTMLLSIIFFIIFLFITLFLSMAFIFWWKEYIGDAWAGSLVVAGFYVLVGLVVYVQRDKLFLNRIVTQISKTILEEEEGNEGKI